MNNETIREEIRKGRDDQIKLKMVNEVTKTPSGRSDKEEIRGLRIQVEELQEEIMELKSTIREIIHS